MWPQRLLPAACLETVDDAGVVIGWCERLAGARDHLLISAAANSATDGALREPRRSIMFALPASSPVLVFYFPLILLPLSLISDNNCNYLLLTLVKRKIEKKAHTTDTTSLSFSSTDAFWLLRLASLLDRFLAKQMSVSSLWLVTQNACFVV